MEWSCHACPDRDRPECALPGPKQRAKSFGELLLGASASLHMTNQGLFAEDLLPGLDRFWQDRRQAKAAVTHCRQAHQEVADGFDMFTDLPVDERLIIPGNYPSTDL